MQESDEFLHEQILNLFQSNREALRDFYEAVIDKQSEAELRLNEALDLLRQARHVIQSYTSQSTEFIDKFLGR